MKKIVKITSLLLVLTLALFAVACSSYGKVEKAFLNEGYVVATEKSEGVKADLFNKEVTVHEVTKSATIGSVTVYICEFKSVDELKEEYLTNSSMRLLAGDLQDCTDMDAAYEKLEKDGYANGNCFVCTALMDLISANSSDAIKLIVKNA